MRIAVLSDIHGNFTALQAVLREVDGNPDIDRIVVLGDTVGLGPQPNETVQTLRERNIEAVLGNYDDAVAFDRIGPGVDFASAEDEAAARAAVAWTRSILTAENMEWLRALPRDVRIFPGPGGGKVQRDTGDERADEYRKGFFARALFGGLVRTPKSTARRIRMVHGSPRALNEFVREESANSILATLAEHAQAEVLVSGHARAAFSREAGGITFVGIGPVDSSVEGNPTAEYGIVNVAATIEARFNTTEYDLTCHEDAVRGSGMPERPTAIARFQRR